MLMAKLEAERKLKDGISGHRTGLPKKLLELFAPLEPLGGSTPMKHRKPALPYTGMGQYLATFAQPGDEEYEPEQKPERPDSPRRFRNPELKHQARVEQESKLEKCAAAERTLYASASETYMGPVSAALEVAMWLWVLSMAEGLDLQADTSCGRQGRVGVPSSHLSLDRTLGAHDASLT